MLDLEAVPIADDARRLAAKLADGSTPLDHALGDGEDFELILAVPPDEAEAMLAEQPLALPSDATSASSSPSRACGRSMRAGGAAPAGAAWLGTSLDAG